MTLTDRYSAVTDDLDITACSLIQNISSSLFCMTGLYCWVRQDCMDL
jgi:hypothetical protein